MIEIYDIEKMFNSEIRDKKRAANGVHSKTGTRGYVGKMLFASDLLRGKEKREYIKPIMIGEYNMYDVILKYDHFTSLTADEKIKYLSEYTKRYTLTELAEAWNLSYKTLYAKFQQYNIPVVKRSPRGRATGSKASAIPKQAAAPKTPQAQPQQPQQPDGFSISLHGEYSAADLVQRLERISLIMSDDENIFNVEIKITQRA